MSDFSNAKMAAASTVHADVAARFVSIRVSPNGYFTAFFLLTFLSAFLFYLEKNYAAVVVAALNLVITPLLAWNDRITFDGKRLARTGFLPVFWARLNARKYRLRIGDVEQVESQALRALKRGGNVFYRYRTSLQGRNLKFAFASGGDEFRQMIQHILPLVPDDSLDTRSIELRDFLHEPKETLMKAAFAHIPAADVLENSFGQFAAKISGNRIRQNAVEEAEKADYLHVLGNELRVSGYLLQALEAFRRALVLTPQDARLIFDFARCLYSYGSSEKNIRLKKRAFAALRLAEKRARENGELLARIGESYFQYGDGERASRAFKKAVESSKNNFRAMRGLAEIALREGKIGYVILHFAAAQQAAGTPALRRWTRNENDYFARLQSDEDYMEMEISRVNLLETLETLKKTCLKAAFVGIPFLIVGLFTDDFFTGFGWTISLVALTCWVILLFAQYFFATRIPMNFQDGE